MGIKQCPFCFSTISQETRERMRKHRSARSKDSFNKRLSAGAINLGCLGKRLTGNQKQKVRSLFVDGLTYSAIARETGHTRATVRRVINAK